MLAQTAFSGLKRRAEEQEGLLIGTPGSVDQMARDVVQFLGWAAEPKLEERKGMGIKVVLFLVVLTGLTFALKRKIWSDVPH